MGLNVYNMPKNTLYRFDINKYVWTTDLMKKRSNNKEDADTTEVFEITDEGYMKLLASGKLVTEEDSKNEFGIFDYEKNGITSFKVTMELEELKLKDLYMLREAIAINNRKKNKK